MNSVKRAIWDDIEKPVLEFRTGKTPWSAMKSPIRIVARLGDFLSNDMRDRVVNKPEWWGEPPEEWVPISRVEAL